MDSDDWWTLIKIGFWGLVVSGVIFSWLFAHFGVPETGEHVGYITETGYGGLIWKTHYVKLVSTHFVSGDKEAKWYYGINENDLTYYITAQSFQNADKPVKISYRCDLFVWQWERTDACIITNIQQM